MDRIRKELAEVPLSYPADHLHNSYYFLLNKASQEEITQDLTRFVSVLRQSLTGVSPNRKLRILYEVLSQSLTYDDAEYPEGRGALRFSCIGGIRSGKAVCMGIAEMLTLLASALDLRIQTVIGYGGDPVHNGGLHAWNIVWLPENGVEVPYHVDLTWDLSEYVGARGYRFYLKSDDYMRKHDHYWLPERYPRCPRDGCLRQIPHIQPEAIRLICRRLETLRTTNTNDKE